MSIENHAFNKRIAGIPNAVCSKCGMIKLNNDFSRWCIQNGCNADERPDYLFIRKQLTK